MRDEACGVGAAGNGARGIDPGDCGSDDSAIAATIVTIGSNGMHAIASRALFIPRVIHDAAIEATHAPGNVTKPKTIAQTSGFEPDPGASNAIGAPTAAIARIGRGLRLSGTIALLREAFPAEKSGDQQRHADEPDQAANLSDLLYHAARIGRTRHLTCHDPKECAGTGHESHAADD
jgi:hypothetical protein